jgi:hypothetical protein
MPLSNSNIYTRDILAVKLPAQGVKYPCSQSGWTLVAELKFRVPLSESEPAYRQATGCTTQV